MIFGSMFVVQLSIACIIGTVENKNIIITAKNNRSKWTDQIEYIIDIKYSESSMERQRRRKGNENHLSLQCISRFHFIFFDLTLIQLPVQFTYECGHNVTISTLSTKWMFCASNQFSCSQFLYCHLFDAINWHQNLFAPAIQI